MQETIEALDRRFRQPQQFKLGQVVACPVAVAESGKARIVGVEWGPQYGKGKVDCTGWLYWLVEVSLQTSKATSFVPKYVAKGGSPWAAGESELLKWGNS